MNPYWKSLLPFLSQASDLTREDIWEGERVYRPSVRKNFAEYPRLGCFGDAYTPGGGVLVGANGNSTEGQNADRVEARYADQDRKHIGHLEAFHHDRSEQAFARLNRLEKEDILGWHMD